MTWKHWRDAVETQLTILMIQLVGDLVQVASPLFHGNLCLVQTHV